MSRPHENDVSFSMKTETLENALQNGKIWKRNSIGFVLASPAVVRGVTRPKNDCGGG